MHDQDGTSRGRHKPGLTDHLGSVDLNVAYHRAAGDTLGYRSSDGQEVDVLDLVGGYGVLLFGHQHPAIVSAATEFLASGCPNHVQGSIRPGANQLARLLAARVGGDYCTVFANSGTEAVEAAVKHAMFETEGRTFVTVDGGFHGKTLGSLRLTSNPRFRTPFTHDDANVVRVTANDVDQLRYELSRVRSPAGFIYEPIQGEAGVRPLAADFVQVAARWCADHNVPLIADECQTGVGRCGKFLASEWLGVTPDYILLSKALGGGLAKISALMISTARYCPQFDLIHSSTYADDEFSCAVASKVLELVDEPALAHCRATGDFFIEQLQSVQRRYPSVMADVRGRGLMMGVEFKTPAFDAGFVLNHLSDRHLLGSLIASFLLKNHRMRVAPTLSDSRTLRIQPSIGISRNQVIEAASALANVCDLLDRGEVAGLTSHLDPAQRDVGLRPSLLRESPSVFHYQPRRSCGSSGHREAHNEDTSHRVAWIFHFIDSSDLDHLDPGLRSLSDASKQAFCRRWSSLAEPIVMPAAEVGSSTGDVTRLLPILLPVTSEWMLGNARGKRDAAPRLVQRAVDVAKSIGCDVAALGQFTSIVTRCGATLQHRGLQITAGSSYTASLVNDAVRAEISERSWDPSNLVLAVVGATGDIASTCARMLGPEFAKSVLIGSGRVGSRERLQQVARRIPRSEIANNSRAIRDAHVVVCATNRVATSIGVESFRDDAIVCDASVPAMVDPHVERLSPGVTLCLGAIVQLPGREHIQIPGFPLPPGYAYGCMAEGLLLGLERKPASRWDGRSSAQRALTMSRFANRHGFRVAKSSDVYPFAESAQ